MKYCSLCNMSYDDNVKNCQLSHCVSCGSTRLHIDKSMQVNPIALIFTVAMFGIIFWALIFDKMEEISFIVIMFGMFMVLIITSGYSSKTVYLCLNCLAKGFVPLTKAPLQNSKIENKNQDVVFKNIDPQDIAKLTKSNLHIQNRFDLRTILLIIGVAIAIITLIFGDVVKKTIESSF